MNARRMTYMLAALAFSLCLLLQSNAEGRTWTGKNGKAIQAEFVDVSTDGTRVALRRPDGSVIKTAIANLIDEDRKHIDKLLAERFLQRFRQAEADYQTGLKYYLGAGVRQDFETAIAYYRRAAQANYRDAFFDLGLCYAQGTGVPKDLRQARTYYQEAAERGHTGAQNNLGLLLKWGDGGDRNQEKALYWYRKAAEAESPPALNNLGVYEKGRGNATLAADYFMRSGKAYLKRNDRDGVLKAIDRLQSVGALVLARTLSDQLYGNPGSRPSTPGGDQPASSGTGWFCTPKHLVTCWHVLEGHDRFYLVSETFPKTPLNLVTKDRQNDLAVLEMPGHDLASHGFLPLSTRNPSTAEKVFTSGFPHVDLLGKAPKYTEGSISATSGIDDDPRILQISVPVQAGNSGGPLLGADGRVVGVVASKLAAARVFEWTGDLPQNINYAVKSAYLRTLLDSKGIKYTADTAWAKDISRPELIKEVNQTVVLILAE